jgi:2-methylcitrate dehydratase
MLDRLVLSGESDCLSSYASLTSFAVKALFEIISMAANKDYDPLLLDIARYAASKDVGGPAAYASARLCLMDAVGCGLQAFEAPDCTKLIGPVVPGTIVPNGARVPGTQFELDPIKAAFDISCLVRWLDFNDTWWAGGHPSDNIGGILATADYLSRARLANGKEPLVMRDVLAGLIKAYEIQGVLIEGNKMDIPEIGLDSTIVVKVASTAVCTQMFGGSVEEIANALSNAFVDGHPLNLYRVKSDAGPRKSWAAADATSRGVRLAMMAVRGEMGYRSAISAKTWGFSDVLYNGKPLVLPRALASSVIENIQFKISFPAQRHSQTAAECAVKLHPQVKDRIDAIARVELTTHQLAQRMISVTGPLPNFAARDHCLQYIVAMGLLDGDITTASYEDARAADPKIDALREKMVVTEDPRFTADYNDLAKCANPNAVQVFFKDGSSTPKVQLDYPVGDPRRRKEGIPLLERKFRGNLARRFPAKQQQQVADLIADQSRLEATPVNEFMELLMI